MKEGGSIKVASLLKEEGVDSKDILIQIFADQTYFGCGIFVCYTTQEEASLRDCNPDIFGYLLDNEYITPIAIGKGTFKLEYIKKEGDSLSKLSTSEGYVINGKISKTSIIDPAGTTFMLNRLYQLEKKKYTQGQLLATKTEIVNGINKILSENPEYLDTVWGDGKIVATFYAIKNNQIDKLNKVLEELEKRNLVKFLIRLITVNQVEQIFKEV